MNEALFWSHVERADGCWLWTGTIKRDGYGIFSHEGAHRIAYRLLRGPIPPGLEIDHLCRVRNCVNPDHLEAVTHAVNMARSYRPSPVACIHGHPFTPENTYLRPPARRGGKLQCRTCNALAAKRYAERKRAA